MPPPDSDTLTVDEAASAPPASPVLRRARLLAVALVVVGLVVAQRTGVLHLFAEPAAVKRTLLDLGPWGQLAFVVAYAALQPFGVPGTVFVFAAPLIWPWPVAFGLSMAGTMAASVVGFSFARFVARDWIASRVPARFRRYDEALARRGFTTVATLRFLFWMPQALHAFLGISKVPFWTHFWGSAVGYVVPLLATAYFGEKLLELAQTAPASVWVALGAGVASVVLAVWLLRRARARRARGVGVS